MHIERLRERVPSTESLCTGVLNSYSLSFNKRSRDNSGKCNINYTGNEKDKVFGVIYEIALSEKQELDRAEGLGLGYAEENISVLSECGNITAFTYIAEKNVIDDKLRPYFWYRQYVVYGAKHFHLPENYIEMIEKIEYWNDSDEKRAKKNLEILNRLKGS